MIARNTDEKPSDTGKWYFISFRDPVKNRNLGCCNV
jgi:hypothetical protein